MKLRSQSPTAHALSDDRSDTEWRSEWHQFHGVHGLLASISNALNGMTFSPTASVSGATLTIAYNEGQHGRRSDRPDNLPSV
jgi:hypothetical protein